MTYLVLFVVTFALITSFSQDFANAGELLTAEFFQTCAEVWNRNTCLAYQVCENLSIEACDFYLTLGDAYVQYYQLCFCCQISYCADGQTFI